MCRLPWIASTLTACSLIAAFAAAPAGAQDIMRKRSVMPPPGQTARPSIARGLIVELKPGSPANPNLQTPQVMRDRLAAVARAAELPAPEAQPRQVGAHGYLLRFAAPLQGAALDAAVQNAAANPDVQSVSPDVRMRRLDTAPNDPWFADGTQWYLRAPSDPAGGVSALNTPPVWDVTIGLNGPVVAVVDSGALFNHEDLASQFIPGYDFISDVAAGNTGLWRNPDASDPGDWVSAADVRTPEFAGCEVEPSSWHGSFIAGIIGAATNNAIGVAGIDWNAKILPVRVSGKCGAWLSDIIDGLRWAAGLPVTGVPANPTPARVISISLGGDEACEPTYQLAINAAIAQGALVVVAAGNSNMALGSPAGCSGVLTVGAARQDGLKTFYSSLGAGMGLMAPGGADETALPNDWVASASNTGLMGPELDTYIQAAGTSFSAPMAAGVAALMLTVNPMLSPAQLIALLKQSARPFPNDPIYPACANGLATACNCTPQTCGAGLLDADAAVQLALNTPGNWVPPSAGGGGNGSGGGGSGSGSGGGGSGSGGSSGGGGTMGWLWGLGLWSLAAAALWRRRKTA